MDKREQIIQEYLGKLVRVMVDRPIGYRRKGLVYPVTYGYIPGLMAGDGEEQDAYILGVSEPLEVFEGRVIGVVRRKNDDEDKLVVAPEGQIFHQAQIAEAVHFQEQFCDTKIQACFEKSCGVLPFRMKDGRREILLVFEHFSKCWSLPKGHMEMGETEEMTALRELREETGLTAVLDPSRCAAIEYPISRVARKQVLFFPGLVSGEPRVRPGEIEKYKWVSFEQLQDYLFPDTVEACRKLIQE